MSKPAVKPVAKSKALMAAATKQLRPMDRLDRHEIIAKEAYFLAEKRGFQGGDPVADWLKAESKIDCKYNEKMNFIQD